MYITLEGESNDIIRTLDPVTWNNDIHGKYAVMATFTGINDAFDTHDITNQHT